MKTIERATEKHRCWKCGRESGNLFVTNDPHKFICEKCLKKRVRTVLPLKSKKLHS